jgi:type I restriction enzyme S subunit
MKTDKFPLGKIAKVISGYAFKSKEFTTNGIPVIKIKNIKKENVSLNELFYVNPKFLTLNEKYHINKDDLLISLTGSHITQPNSVVGRVALNRFDTTFLLNQRAGKIIVNEEIYSKRFLFYYLAQNKTQEEICYLAQGAANQANISPSGVESIKVPNISLPTQKRIADILSAYDDLIENNNRRIALLEQAARHLYKEWFVRFKFPGHEKVKIQDGVPEGWERKKLGEIIEPVKRLKKIQKNEYLKVGAFPCIDQSQEFIGGYTDIKEAIYFDQLPVIIFGDHTRVIKYIDFPFACGADGTQILKSEYNGITQPFLYYLVSEIDLSNYFYARHFKFLKASEILIPNKSLINIFTLFSKDNLAQISYLRKYNLELSKLRDLLLPKLMNGSVVV